MGLLDAISAVPVSKLEEDTGWDLSGLDNATQVMSDITGASYIGDHIAPYVHSAEDASLMGDILGPLKEYMGELFETSETAAKNQMERNELLAENAWKRSELAADAAALRARELRQTAYQDAVKSLKAAGLNPVLAAGGGISGSAVTAPQANAPAASSGMADGLNAADLLSAVASLLSGAGNLVKGLNPVSSVMNVDKNGAVSETFYHFGK